MEIWDAYLEDGSLAGRDLIRDEKIPDGLFHLVCEIIVRHSDGDFLLMQRDFNKKMYPGLFEATASGSALKGESALEGAIRELKEETGIDSTNLFFLSKSINHLTHGIYYIYLCETNCDKDSITLQEGETINFQWMRQDLFLKFIESDKYVKVNRERMQGFLSQL